MRARHLGGLLLLVLLLPLLAACGSSSSGSSEPPPEGLSITSVSPDRGSMNGGYRAQVRGSGFSAGVTQLTFGGVAATEVSASGDTTLNCTVPGSREAGAVDVAVTTSAGTATLEGGFTYNSPPRVFFVAPAAGWSGVTVSIVGLGFSSYGAGPPTVMFGTQQSLAPQVVNDTLIFATVPPNPGAGLVEVSVTNANGTGTRPNAFLYTQSSFGKAAVLAPTAEGDDREVLHAVLTDLDAGLVEGFVVSEDTGGVWESIGAWPLGEEVR